MHRSSRCSSFLTSSANNLGVGAPREHKAVSLVWLSLALFITSSVAVKGQLPQVSTQPAGPIGPVNATLNGMVVPLGGITEAWFEWGNDSNYGNSTSPTNFSGGGQVKRLSAAIGGLIRSDVYHFRIVASNALGKVSGPDVVFATGTKVSTWKDSTTSFPAIIPGLTNIVGQASGHGHNLAITSEGLVLSWGVGIPAFYPNDGQTNPPTWLSNVVSVAGGWEHSLAVRADGTVVAWGSNLKGQTNVPSTLTNAVAIAGGDSHSIALTAGGTVVAWGDNSSGQLTLPSRLSNVVAITAGSTHSLALRADGTVAAWGSEPFGQPTTPPLWLSNVVTIATETWHNLALRADGTVVAWGNNNYGQTNVPIGLSNVVAIAAGFQHSLALKSDGTLVAWGNPTYVTNAPPGLSNVVAISSGDYHSLALCPSNVPPRAFPKSTSGPINADLVISLQGWDANGDVLSLRISSLPTNGALYQYTGSGRGVPILNLGTPLTDATRIVFSPAPDAYGAPYDTFSFQASDEESTSVGASVNIAILPHPLIDSLTFMSGTNGGFKLTFTGLTNVAYSVQASTNLVNWARLGSANQPLPGQFQFVDSGVTNYQRRFYRVSSP